MFAATFAKNRDLMMAREDIAAFCRECEQLHHGCEVDVPVVSKIQFPGLDEDISKRFA